MNEFIFCLRSLPLRLFFLISSLKSDRMWSFTHNYFRMDPLQGDLSVAGLHYQWDDGIFSITLGPRESNGYRTVYFHPMISTNEFIVNSQVLQTEANALRAYQGQDFKLLGNRGPNTQSAMHHLDLISGVMFYAEIGRNAVGCWNSRQPFNAGTHQVVARDDEKMIYPSDLRVDLNGTVWVMTNSMPVFIYSQLDTNKFNFRVWRANARDLVRGTVCQGSRVRRHHIRHR